MPAATARSVISWVRVDQLVGDRSGLFDVGVSSTDAQSCRLDPVRFDANRRRAHLRDGADVVGRDGGLEGDGSVSAGVGERSLVSCDLGGADERFKVGVLVGDGDRAASVADGFVDATAPERDSGSDDGAIHGEDTVSDAVVGGDDRQGVVPSPEHEHRVCGVSGEQRAAGSEHPDPPGVLDSDDREPGDVVVASGDQVRVCRVHVDEVLVIGGAVCLGDPDRFVGGGDAVVDPTKARQHQAHDAEGGGAHPMSVGHLGHGQCSPERRLGLDVTVFDHQLATECEERQCLDLARWPVGNQRCRLPAGVPGPQPVAGGPAVVAEPFEGGGQPLGFGVTLEERHRRLGQGDRSHRRANAIAGGGGMEEQGRLVETGERLRIGDGGPQAKGALEMVGGVGRALRPVVLRGRLARRRQRRSVARRLRPSGRRAAPI